MTKRATNEFPCVSITVSSVAGIVAFFAIVIHSVNVHAWPPETTYSFPSVFADSPTELVVVENSVTPVEGLPTVRAAWFYYTHEPSSRCTSPPRACYAKSQLIYYRVDCVNRSLSQVQRLTMDLNGDVSTQTDVDTNAPYYVPPFDSLERFAAGTVCAGWTVYRWPPPAQLATDSD